MYQIEVINICSFAIRKEKKSEKCGFCMAFHHNFKENLVRFAIYLGIKALLSQNFINFAPKFIFIEYNGEVKSYKSCSC